MKRKLFADLSSKCAVRHLVVLAMTFVLMLGVPWIELAHSHTSDETPIASIEMDSGNSGDCCKAIDSCSQHVSCSYTALASGFEHNTRLMSRQGQRPEASHYRGWISTPQGPPPK